MVGWGVKASLNLHAWLMLHTQPAAHQGEKTAGVAIDLDTSSDDHSSENVQEALLEESFSVICGAESPQSTKRSFLAKAVSFRTMLRSPVTVGLLRSSILACRIILIRMVVFRDKIFHLNLFLWIQCPAMHSPVTKEQRKLLQQPAHMHLYLRPGH